MKRVIGSILMFMLKACVTVFLIFCLYRCGQYAYDFGYQLYANQGVDAPPGRDVAVVISEGESVSEVADMLERQRLIRNEMVFRIQERLSKYSGQIQPGNYVLNTSQTGEEMLAVLSGHEEDLEEKKEQQ